MGSKIFTRQQQNTNTWMLLALIIILLGAVILLKPNAESGVSPTPPATVPPNKTGQVQPDAESTKNHTKNDWPANIVPALQVGVGAGFLGYIIGFKRGQLTEAKKHRHKAQNSAALPEDVH